MPAIYVRLLSDNEISTWNKIKAKLSLQAGRTLNNTEAFVLVLYRMKAVLLEGDPVERTQFEMKSEQEHHHDN